MISHLDAIGLDHDAGFGIDLLGPEAGPKIGGQHADAEDAVRTIEQVANFRISERSQIEPDELGMALGKRRTFLANRWRPARPTVSASWDDGGGEVMAADADTHVKHRSPGRDEHRHDLASQLIERGGRRGELPSALLDQKRSSRRRHWRRDPIAGNLEVSWAFVPHHAEQYAVDQLRRCVWIIEDGGVDRDLSVDLQLALERP